MASLQDQLLKAGLIDEKKAKQSKKNQRKEAKQRPKGTVAVSEAAEQAKLVQAEKVARDRQINRERQLVVEQKAIAAQIVQLIESNRIDRQGGELPFQFVDGKKIKKIHVSSALLEQLSRGRIAVAKLGERYELIPSAVAEKISQRDASAILLLNTNTPIEADEEDPYADYQIPDDLMWSSQRRDCLLLQGGFSLGSPSEILLTQAKQ